jgi:large subunit ribosomal protein L6
MSRIGNQPVPIPSGVKVSIQDTSVSVEGPKGKLQWSHRPEIVSRIDEGAKAIYVERKDDQRESRALHGLTRSIIANMIQGCSQGYEKQLELYGVGFSAQIQGQKLTLMCGCSHPIVFEIPGDLTVTVTTPQARGDNDPARFSIAGADKQLVGEWAARIRRSRPPEPYKGKGVRYADETVRRKVGKAFAGAGA